MQVFVAVEGEGGERFPLHTIRTRAELERILDFARIGSQTGAPRRVYKLERDQRKVLIARYVGGQSQTSKLMRARRNPLWRPVVGALAGELMRRLLG